MDVNEKIKYQKSRHVVKKWESEFKATKGVAPTKMDIKTAPRRVKDAYGTYWRLKAVLLEASLIDATFDENAKDCFGAVASAKDSGANSEQSCPTVPSSDLSVSISFSQSENKDPAMNESSLPVSFKSLIDSVEKKKPDQDRVLKEPDNTKLPDPKDKVTNSATVWGDHLKVGKSRGVTSLKQRSISFQYTEKLFANAKFSKRNPRKTLRRNRTCDSLPPSGDTASSVADSESQNVTCNASSTCTDNNTSISEAFSPQPYAPSSQQLGESPSSHFDLLSEVKRVVIKEAPRVEYRGVSAVQALMRRCADQPLNKEDGSVKSGPLRQLDPGWLGRLDSDSGIASSSGPLAQEEDEDLICDSDEESNTRFALTKSLGPKSEESFDTSVRVSDKTVGGLSQSSRSLTALTSRLFDSQSSQPSAHIATGQSTGCPSLTVKSGTVPEPSLTHIEVLKTSAELPTGCIDSVVAPAKRLQPDLSTQTAKKPKLDMKPAAVANRAAASKKLAALEKKVSSGDANRNFRRIDIQKKIYCRGKKGMNFSKYKKRQWKELKGLDNSGVIKCFKCGDVGHMARRCTKVGDLLPYEEFEEESVFPTLEEAAEAASKQIPISAATRSLQLLQEIKRKEKTALKESEADKETPKTEVDSETVEGEADPVDSKPVGDVRGEDDDNGVVVVEPLYSLNPDDSPPGADEEVLRILKESGHSEFLPGQEEAIMTVLCGRSCLVVMPTGSGKSLIYRLPAILYHMHRDGAIALVVSPLVSLMEDQVSSCKDGSMGCLHHCQSDRLRKATEEKLSSRQLSVLLVSPELLTSDSAMSLLHKLPPISFACIDEAHCLSHWSHNFRPSYLSVCQVLRDRLKVGTLLGLTASVTSATVGGVLTAMRGPKSDTKVHLVRSNRFVPSNLVLSVSRDGDRDTALVSLLSGDRFAACSSIIVYCTRREECVRVAALLRTNLRQMPTSGRSRLSAVAEVYHAGLTPGRRKQVQNAFMSGKTRIVVATVAFGMGINKRDLRGVIHYNMPSSMENYVQEIGRAGRDGLTAHCHLFLSSDHTDNLSELKRHIYADSADRCSLRHLLELATPQCKGCERGLHEVSLPVDSTVDELDLTQEVISTLTAYLADSDLGFRLLSMAYTKATVASYKGPAHLASLAKQCGVLGVGLAMGKKSHGKVASSAQFDVIKVADFVARDSGSVKRTLKNLEWMKPEGRDWYKTGLNVELSELGFRLIAPCNLSGDQQDTALNHLHDRVTKHESTALKQLHYLYESVYRVAYEKVKDCCDSIDPIRCDKLTSSINHYFTHPNALDDVQIKATELKDDSEVRSTVRRLVMSSGDVKEWTGRSVARILHGISSPRYPALVWASTPFWRSHLNIDFPTLLRLASICLRECR